MKDHTYTGQRSTLLQCKIQNFTECLLTF